MGDPEGSRTERGRTPRAPPTGSAIEVFIRDAIAPSDIPAVWSHVLALLDDGEFEIVVCDVAALVDPDVVTVEALARLQLTARRCGRRVRFRHACGELRGLLTLLGLSDVLSLSPGSALQPGREAEEREPASGVQEEADPGDPVA